MSLGFESYLERDSSRQVYKKFQVWDFIYYIKYLLHQEFILG